MPLSKQDLSFILAARRPVPMVRAAMLSDPAVYALALVAAICIGLAKAGFSGTSLVSVFLLADLYGAKASVGLALPLLIAADLMAYPAFVKHGSWREVWKLLPPALIGLAIGWLILGSIDDVTARRLIGGCILLMVVLQGCRRLSPAFFNPLADTPAFGWGAVTLAGFATMLANAAGPVMQLYLMARRMPKMQLLGISARFFLLLNLLKIPLNARLFLITPDSLWENSRLLPGVVLGIFGGRWLIHRVPQVLFERMIVAFAALAGLRLLFW